MKNNHSDESPSRTVGVLEREFSRNPRVHDATLWDRLAGLLLIPWFFLLCPESVLAVDQSPSQDRRLLLVGPKKDVVSLAVKKDVWSVDPKPVTVRTTTLTFSVNPSGCFIYPAPEGFDYLAVEDLEPFAQTWSGEPQLPMKTFIVRLDRNAEVYGVEVVGGSYREVQQPVHIVPVPWGKYIPNEELYRTNAFFPGKLLDYERGNDNQRQHVFVRLYPLQYVPGQRKAFLVTKATLRLYWSTPAKSVGAKTLAREQSPGPSIANLKAESVIICPEALRKEASRLSQFHTVTEGIRSSIVTTEAIAAAYQPAADPPFIGYTNRQLKDWTSITNYNYTLAKKMVAYLRDQKAHPRLVYVTLLGDGLLVPPSYYYYPGDFIGWTPTDFFYLSPDYDFVPNYRVGRLPVNDAAEAAQLVDKIIRWHKNARWDWFNNVCLAGGRPYDYMMYTHEMACDEVIRQGLFDGMNVKRFYQSARRREPLYIEPIFTTLGVGLFWYSCHGSVDAMFPGSVGPREIGANNVMRYTANDRVPVVFADACENGAFDLDLVNLGCRLSFGEALLKSPAGGIAVFGASRLIDNVTLYYFQQGQPVVAKLGGMGGLVHYALESYRGGSDTLGELSSDALYAYIANNRMAGSKVQLNRVFAFVLLGDPALKIPVPPAHSAPTGLRGLTGH